MSHNKNCSCSTPLPFPAANQVVAHALETSDTGRGQNDLVAYQDALNRAAIVAITDPSGRITEVNDLFCRISGYARQELIGADHRIVNSGHHSGGFFQQMWRAISSGNIWRADICNRAKDGHLYWVDTTIAPRKDPYGTINGYVAIRFDISRRKEAELEIATQLRRLKTAEKLLADDLTGPVHGHMQSLNMLLCTEGRERSFSQYAQLLEEAGFSQMEGRLTGTPLDAVLAIKG